MPHLRCLTLHQTDPLLLCSPKPVQPLSRLLSQGALSTASRTQLPVPRGCMYLQLNKFIASLPGASYSGPAGSQIRRTWSEPPGAHTLIWEINPRHRASCARASRGRNPSRRYCQGPGGRETEWPGERREVLPKETGWSCVLVRSSRKHTKKKLEA